MKHPVYKIAMAVAIMFLSCSKTAPVEPEDGGPDPNNPNNPDNPGTEVPHRSWQGSAYEVAYQSSGKTICLGFLSKAAEKDKAVTAIYRLDKGDSTLDLSFDTSALSKVWANIGPRHLIVQPDDKILLGGKFKIEGQEYYLLRFTPDGALDMPFIKNTGLSSFPYGVILTQSAHIFVLTQNGDLVKLKSDGTPSSDFNAFIKNVWNPISITLLPDGKLWLVSRDQIFRLNPDGKFDPSFSFKYTIPELTGSEYYAFGSAILQKDGKMIVTGRFRELSEIQDKTKRYDYLNIARFNTDGTLDPSFEKQSSTLSSVGFYQLADGTFIRTEIKTFYTNNIQEMLRHLDKDGKTLSEQLIYGYLDQVIQLPGKKLRLIGNFFNPYNPLELAFNKYAADSKPIIEISME